MNYQDVLTEVFESVKQHVDRGHVASYIPELAKVAPDRFGVHLSTVDNVESGAGDCFETFSIQSIAKVLSLCLAYKLLGEKIWNRVDVEPSGTAFNSLVQLELERGMPRNPFNNSGALVMCDVLVGKLDDPKADFIAFVRGLLNDAGVDYSESTAESEKAVGYRNIALCNLIKSFGNIHNCPSQVLDFYFNICSIKMSCQQISRAFLFLANNGVQAGDGQRILTMRQCKRVNAIMQTCGFYDESGEFAFKVGLPGKSGVGGGIMAIHPGKYCVATWGPRLNGKGNSFRGMKFLELLTTKTQSSIF